MDGSIKSLSSLSPIKPTQNLKTSLTDLEQKSSSKEANENSQESNQMDSKLQNIKKLGTKHFMSPTVSAASKVAIPRKKILAERKEALGSNSSDTHFHRTPHVDDSFSPSFDSGLDNPSGYSTHITPLSSKISDTEHDCPDLASKSYDPLTNYLSPRPKFLRYNPNRRFEILHRCGREMRKSGDGLGLVESKKLVHDESPSTAYASSPSPSSQERSVIQEDEYSPHLEKLWPQRSHEETSDCEEEEDEDDEEVEEEVWCWKLNKVLKFLLLLGVLILSTLYISSMNSPTSSPCLQNMWGLKEKYQNIQNHDSVLGNHVFGSPADDFVVTSISLKLNEENYDNLMEVNEEVEKVEMIGQGEVSDQVELFGRETAEIVYTDMGTEKPSISETDVKSDAEITESGLSSGEEQVQDEGAPVMWWELNELPLKEVSYEKVGKEEMVEYEVEKEDVMSERGGQNVVKSDGETISETPETELRPSEDQVRDEAVLVMSWELNELPLEEVSNEGIEQEEILEHEVGEGVGHQGIISGTNITSVIGVNPKKELLIVYLGVCLLPIVLASMFLRFLHCMRRKLSMRNVSQTTGTSLGSSVLEDRALINGGSIRATKEKGIEEQTAKANSSFSPSSSVHSEGKGSIQLYRSQAPTVELLGEYVVGGQLSSSIKSCNMKTDRIETEESSFSQSVQSQENRRPRRKGMSPAANQDLQSAPEFSATESHSYGSLTLQEKIVIKEEGKDGEEVMKVVTTPVRRSSRIRNRVMSP